MLRRILAGSRYLIIIAVLGTFLAAIAVLVYGGLTVVHVIYEMFASSQFTTDEAKHFATILRESLSVWLLFC